MRQLELGEPSWIRTPLAWAAVSSALDIVLGVRLRFAWWMLPMCAGALALAWVAQRWRGVRWGALLVCCAALGFSWGSLRATVPPLPAEGAARVTGHVAEIARVREDSATLYLDRATLEIAGRRHRVPGKLWLRYKPEQFSAAAMPKPGQQISVEANVYRPQGQRNPGGFDFRAYLLREGTYMTAYAYQAWTISGAPDNGPKAWLRGGRERLSRRMDALYGKNVPLIQGMLIGDTQDVTREDYRAFQRSGLAHLLSVSGLHVGFLALPLLWLARKLALRGWQRLLLVGSLLMLYCLLVGAPPSTVRACVMLLMLQSAPVLGRPYDALSSLAAVFWGMLVFNPLALWDLSLTLSCSAVLGIALLSAPCRKLFGRLPKWPRDALALSLAAQLGALPLVALYFNELPLFGLLTNLLAVPVSAVVVLAGMAATLLDFVWAPLALPLAWAVRGAAALLMWLSNAAASLHVAVLRVASPPWYVVAAGYVAIALIGGAVKLGKPWRKWALSVVCLAASIAVWQLTAWRGVQYVQLDVGQSDAAVLRAGGYTVVIDTGSQGTGGLIDYLNHEGLAVDALFISHPHEDHAGALLDLVAEGVPIRRILLPGALAELPEAQMDPAAREALLAAQRAGIPFEPLSAGQQLTLSPALQVTVLSPAAGVRQTDVNDLSLVLRFEAEGVRILTTGDITSNAEPLRAVDCDVLKVAHHGSKYSSDAAFLQAAHPKLALLSVGRNNYGHPAPEVLERLAEADARVLRTDLGGALILTLEQGTVAARTYLPYPEQEGEAR